MKTLICPISPMRIDRTVVRITGLMMALMIALYIYTGQIHFVTVIVLDYFIRAWTPLPHSPFSWLARAMADAFQLPRNPIDKAPKIFAARVGFLFALTTVVLFYVHPLGSLLVGAALMGFALLESVFDICVGCLVYTYVVLPLFGERV